MLRGALWWADLGLPRGSAPALRRPVRIVSADKYNRSNLRTVTVAIVTTNAQLAALPGNVATPADVADLEADSVLNVTQVATVEEADTLRLVVGYGAAARIASRKSLSGLFRQRVTDYLVSGVPIRELEEASRDEHSDVPDLAGCVVSHRLKPNIVEFVESSPPRCCCFKRDALPSLRSIPARTSARPPASSNTAAIPAAVQNRRPAAPFSESDAPESCRRRRRRHSRPRTARDPPATMLCRSSTDANVARAALERPWARHRGSGLRCERSRVCLERPTGRQRRAAHSPRTPCARCSSTPPTAAMSPTCGTSRVGSQLARLHDLHVMGAMTKPQYAPRRRALEQELERLGPPTDLRLDQAATLLADSAASGRSRRRPPCGAG